MNDHRIDRVDVRARIAARRSPYWQRLARGRFLGFRKMSASSPGTWLARFHAGDEGYDQKPLGDFGLFPEKERYDAAKRAAEEWFSHRDAGGAANSGTVKGACEAYVAHLRAEKSEATADEVASRFARLVYGDPERKIPPDPIARVELSKLTKVHVGAWRERVLKRGAKSSFNRNATALRAALNHAHGDAKIASDVPWREKLKPITGAGNPRTLYLDRDARRSLIDHATDEARPLLRAINLLPVRVGEVANARVADLDTRHRTLRLSGKTGERVILLPDEAFAHLKECARKKLPTAWLIARADGSQWKKAAWRDEVKLAAEAAKLPKA